MNEEPLPDLPEEQIITPNSPDRFPLLLASSQPCDVPLNSVDRRALDDMNDLLEELGNSAAGIAAVQIGYPKRMFMLRRHGQNEAFVNPALIRTSQDKARKQEGCLSLPNMVFRIARPKSVTLQWFDENCGSHEETFTGFWARAVCHEMSHLCGRLLTDEDGANIIKEIPRTSFGMKITDASQKRIKQRRAKNKRGRKSKRKNRIG